MTPRLHQPHTTDPLHRRLAAYLQERFPVGPYSLLVVLFAGSALLTALPGLPTPRMALTAPLLWLVFLHLRLFDEHKDYARDIHTHPERLLSRGVVTLDLLGAVAALVLFLELVLAALLGGRALGMWAVTVLFTLAMRYEFGIGAFLNRHMLLYAITHNPVVALLAGVVFAAADAPLGWAGAAYIATVSLASLAFELARKTRLPAEEVPGEDSYSSVYGQQGARLLIAGTCVGALLCAFPLVQGWMSWSMLALAALAAFLPLRPGQPAKAIERGASLFLLLIFVAIAIANA